MRVIRIGDKNRPATKEDIAEVQRQLQAVANDPNLTIVEHFAFDFDEEEIKNFMAKQKNEKNNK